MNKSSWNHALEWLREHCFDRRWKMLLTFLAAIVVFITTYMLILPAITLENNIVCGMEEHSHEEDCYAANGTLICELPEHVHTSECYADDSNEKTELSQTINYTYEDSTLLVTVKLPEGTDVPADAQLRVTAITAEDDDYDSLTEQAQQAISGQTEQIALYDVSFYVNGENGEEYLPVSDTATVSFQFKQSVMEESCGNIAVLHYAQEQENPVPLDTVEVQRDENDAVSELTFETDGFSVFAVVEVLADSEFEVVAPDVNNLDGQTYVITSNGSLYAMMAAQKTTDKLDFQSDKSTASEWTFKSAGGTNTYYISSGSQYLNMSSAGALTLVDEASATPFTVSLSESVNNDGQHITVLANGYYINSFGGEGNLQGFRGFGNLDGGSTLLLYRKTGTTVNNLDGRSFAIVSGVVNKAMTTDTTTVNGVDGLNSVPVTTLTRDDTTYVTGDAPVWKFEAVTDGSDGQYYISTQDSETTKYLCLLETDYNNISKDGRGSLTLETTKQAITVTVADDGKVYLTATVAGKTGTGYVNLDNAVQKFWTYNAEGNYSALRLCEVIIDGPFLEYDLNMPGMVTSNGSRKSWLTTPTISSRFQSIVGMTGLIGKPDGYYNELGYAGKIYKEKNSGIADADNPYYGLYRMYVITPNNLVTNNLPTEHMNEEEYLFLGWVYTDSEGKKHKFAPDATVIPKGDNSAVVLTDKDGVSVEIPAGSTLQGEWVQVSAPVYFFVNYTGTILDTEGDVAGRGGAFLNGTAIGHILFAKQTVGSSGTYALAVHEEISSMFRSKDNVDLPSDGSIPATQIIIETATTAEGEDLALTNDEKYGEANAKIILKATLSWIQTQSGVSLYISTGNGQTKANSDQLTTDNYSIRWYVAKEQNDAWHIDGVLTAVTKNLVVTKSFAGLTPDEIEALTDESTTNGAYAIDLWIRGNDSSATYMTLNTTSSYTDSEGHTQYGVPGQYSFDDYDPVTQTAKWTVRLLAGEHVTLTEKDYDVTNYISSSYSVIDGNGESIYEGDYTGYDLAQDENNDIYDIVGGINGEVAFSNTYTKIGKGSLSILKKNAATGNVMQNVTFTLQKDGSADAPFTAKTNASGRVDFMNLEPGTYTLEETTPSGFKALAKTMKVIVEIPDGEANAVVSVYEGETKVSESTDSVLYVLANEPDDNTLIVEKTFKDITKEEVEALSNYKITLIDKDSDASLSVLNKVNANYISADGLRYSWIVTGVVDGKSKIVKESGYGSTSYIDTKISAEVTVGSIVTQPEPTIPLLVGEEGNTASVEIETQSGVLNKVSLTNTYTNEFVLYLRKTDTITGQPLKGAVFKLYGSYDEATNAKDTIKYRAADDSVKTLYYIGNSGASDENGLAMVEGLNLSSEGKTYVYILSEYIAPDGYAKPSYPEGIVPNSQVITVTVDNIKNNIYSTSMVNQTIGAPLIIKKEVPKSDLDVSNTYQMQVTISANEASIRNDNRTYQYQIYNADGTAYGTIETAKGTMPEGTLNIDTVTFTIDLEVGQYVVVKDVPIGYNYSVTENIPSDAGYDCAMENKNGTGSYDNFSNTIAGTILEVPAEITNPADEGYEANVEARKLNTVTVNNYAQANITDAKTTITVKKLWSPEDKAGSQAIVNLYQVTNGSLATAKLYSDGGEQTLKASEDPDKNWTYTWTDLPLYNSGGTETYDYYIAEVPVDGYSQGYSDTIGVLTPETLTVEGKTVYAVHATTATITVINTTGFELPASGGIGTWAYGLCGLLAAGSAAWLCLSRKRSRKES